MAEIQLKHVYKKYEDKVVAVQDFNLKIKDQEFVIFVGPSGCGKSTTLRMIAGLEEISDGELLIDGKMMNHSVFHHYNLGSKCHRLCLIMRHINKRRFQLLVQPQYLRPHLCS